MVSTSNRLSQYSATERRNLRRKVLDPALFTEKFLGDDLWEMQKAIMRSVAVPYSRTAVKACHASSKTHTAGRIVTWFLTRYRKGIVLTTAPTWTQVRRLLWAEIRQSAESRFTDVELLTTEMRGPDPDNYALGLSTDEGVRFQGFHADHMLIVMDEAPGVRPDIWASANAIRAGGDVRFLVLGNPVVASGPFYDLFTGPGAELWTTFTISAFDTPNLAGLTIDDVMTMPEAERYQNPRPYLITRQWVYEKYIEALRDETDEDYQARVLADFPTQASTAIFPVPLLTKASRARVVPEEASQYWPWVAGIDVAGPGEDETVVVVRHGPRVVDVHAFPDADSRGKTLAALLPYKDKLATVHVDVVGLGAYFAHHLRDQGYPVVDFNAGGKPRNVTKFTNRKAEAHWAFREALSEGLVMGLTDQTMVRQLAAITYGHTPLGRIEVESKEKLKKRGISSPDRAEALIMAFLPVEDTSLADWAPVSLEKESVWG